MHNSSSSTCFKASFPIYITRCTQPAGYQSRRIQDQGYSQIAPPNFYAVQRKTPWLTKIAHLVLLLQECGGRQTRPIDCRRHPCARTRPKETNEAEARRAACICRHASVRCRARSIRWRAQVFKPSFHLLHTCDSRASPKATSAHLLITHASDDWRLVQLHSPVADLLALLHGREMLLLINLPRLQDLLVFLHPGHVTREPQFLARLAAMMREAIV
jgi:hypothetical protein